MAKKKPPKGKPPNRSTTHPGSASRSTSASKPRAVSPHAAGSDSATGKVDPGFPPVKDAQTTATVGDLAMEIENPNLENLATESNAVPRPTVPDTTVDANTAFMTWTSFIEWISLKDSTTPLILKRLVAHATIYNIWAERNKRLHQGISSTPQTIYKLIDRNIRDTILGKKNIKKSFKTLMLSWLRNV
ncbi:hypothetical protein DY000_02049318 [Brassica cretica]|uniref:Uncharacterized protein n=1 Tax=Brassica cretica TaxID=69181 RepID=A0ABQ7F7G2_BRACR|nr:hypothetical protein DY000_02049318 [Brassica cretica]